MWSTEVPFTIGSSSPPTKSVHNHYQHLKFHPLSFFMRSLFIKFPLQGKIVHGAVLKAWEVQMLALQSLRYTWIFVCCFQCEHIYILIELWGIVLLLLIIWNNGVSINLSLCSCRLMISETQRNLNLPVFKRYCVLQVLPVRDFLLILKASRMNWTQREWGLFPYGSPGA